MKTLLIVSLIIGLLATAAIFSGLAAAAFKRKDESGIGYQVIVTVFKPYRVYPYSLSTSEQVDSLIIEHYGPAFSGFSTRELMQTTNQFYTQTDSFKIEIERKEIKEIRNGEVILRKREYKNQ